MAERERIEAGASRVGSGREGTDQLERKYWLALALYGVLAVGAWFTIGEGRVEVFGRLIEVRWVPVFVLATFAFRTVMAMQAERIRNPRSQNRGPGAPGR